MKGKTIITALAIAGAVTSCVGISGLDSGPHSDVDGEYASISMVVPPIEILEDDPLTRMTVDIAASPIAYLWAEKDTVGIFPENGSQIYLSMADGVGTSEVNFDGGGWGLRKNTSYYSYFPFIPDFYIRKNAIPMSFEGQSQKGNADPNVADIGRYCFMAAKGVSDEGTGNLMFEYERLGVLTRYKIPVDAGTYTSLTVKAGSPVIAYKGTFNSMEIDRSIQNAAYSDELSMSLEDMTFAEPAVLVAFMMMPPFDILNKQLTVELTKSDGTVVTSSAFGKNYQLGTAYGSAMHVSVYAKNDLIDGNGGSAQVVINASGSDAYTVSTDVDWLTLGSRPTSGSAVVTVTAGKGTTTQRTGHVIVSEQVSYKGTTITLQNKVLITQEQTGMAIGVGGWGDGENIKGEL